MFSSRKPAHVKNLVHAGRVLGLKLTDAGEIRPTVAFHGVVAATTSVEAKTCTAVMESATRRLVLTDAAGRRVSVPVADHLVWVDHFVTALAAYKAGES